MLAGATAEQVSGMIALGYGVTYIWGTVGIILICKYLPRWWGVDAKAAAKQYEEEHGVKNVDDAGVTGYRDGGIRAYRVENPATVGKSISAFRKANPQYKIVNVVRGENTASSIDENLSIRPPITQRNWLLRNTSSCTYAPPSLRSSAFGAIVMSKLLRR